MKYSIEDIARIIGAQMVGQARTKRILKILTDSRALTSTEDSLFFALKTSVNDGHKYIPELIEKGVSCFVVHSDYQQIEQAGLVYLKVDNTLKALQQLAQYHRHQFDLPVFGITGSNGKTVVKEWLLQLFGHHKKVCANPKSYNSQIGAPLSVWQLNESHELALFEAGISTVGEMQNLQSIIDPTYGILTHLGPAHNEGFDSPEQKIQEKLSLFKNAQLVFGQQLAQTKAFLGEKLIGFGFNEPKADLNILDCVQTEQHTTIYAQYKGKDLHFNLPFKDTASIENACLCCLIMHHFDAFDASAFEQLRAVSMRMELKKGIHQCVLVNDGYNNDLNALSNALSFLKQQAMHAHKTAILSDIEGSGIPPEILYTQVKQMLFDKGIKRLIGIGPQYSKYGPKLFKQPFDAVFYSNTENFLNHFYEMSFKDESILIKGARKFEFEQIVKKLEKDNHNTVLEINLNAAVNNLNAFKQHLPKDMKIMAMVKAFAYGSGSYEMAKLIEKRVDYLAVAYADEGVALRQTGVQAPIMVMNAGIEQLEVLIQYQLEPVVFDLEQLKAFKTAVQEPLNIHIELDTGMHRLGFVAEQVPALIEFLKQNPLFLVASIFSHLSASDEALHDTFTQLQFDQFKQWSNLIEDALQIHTIKHISNTAAALRFQQAGLNMVRLGIGLYGINPSQDNAQLLEPVFTLKTHISQIKTIQANESVGYARKAMSDKTRKIAVLALGYADGLNRGLSNGIGGFYIKGQRAEIIGNICMDMCMVDVSSIDCQVGDEAILFGKDFPIQDIAKQLHTIPYEILTSISQRVIRVYVSE